MLQGYKWTKTDRIVHYLREIEVLRRVFEVLPRVPITEDRLVRNSLLKSAVYSARIEGIASTEQEPKLEAQNLLAAYGRIFSDGEEKGLSVDAVRKLHSVAMRNLSSGAGNFRTEPWAVYNEAGVAIHMTPPHYKLAEFMQSYAELVAGLHDHPAEVAGVAQFVLEKIHPFADGNGRVGRLVSAHLLQQSGFGFRGLLMLEEFIEKHRERYYQALVPSHDMTEFVEFFLESIVVQANAALERLKNVGNEKDLRAILPRREEMLAVITDHPKCSFDFMQRRFMSVNPKTLHYDLAWLLKNNLVRKIGVTRGAVYEAS